MALKDDDNRKNQTSWNRSENSSDQEITVKKFEKEFFSLNDFIKWIINYTKIHHPESDGLNDSLDLSKEYVIQTSILNNSNTEVNLEIILKLTTFAGN